MPSATSRKARKWSDSQVSATTKTIYYKTAQFFGDSTNRTLQAMVQTALRKRKAAYDRRQSFDAGDEASFRFINHHGPYKGMKVGILLDYTQGQVQPFTKIDKESSSLPLDALKPPGQGQFVHSLLYFALLDNHVVIAQAASLRSQQFEDYLNWLLRDSGQLSDNQFVALSDQPPPALASEVAQTKGLAINAPVNFQTNEVESTRYSVEENGEETSTRIQRPEDHTKKLSIQPKGYAWEALRKMLPPELELPAELDIDEIVENRQLLVKLELSWRRPRKDDSTSLLDSISNQLRHVDSEVDYTIKTKSGLKISKDTLKLSQQVSVGLNDTGLIKREELWPSMLGWLEDLINNQRVLPEE